MNSDCFRKYHSILGILIILFVVALPLSAQENSPVDALLEKLKQSRDLFFNIDFPGSIKLASEIIDELSPQMNDALPDESINLIMVQALELRAISAFNLNEESVASEDFKYLLKIAPDHELDKEIASPLIEELYKRIKNETIGTLSLITDPEGASIFIGERQIGISNLTEFSLTAGDHEIKIQKPGYADVIKAVTVQAGQSNQITIPLDRITASLRLRSSPSEVEVYLDGLLVGETRGTAGSDYAAEVSRAGLTLDLVSEEFVIPYIEPGNHKIEFKKECFRTLSRISNVASASDYNLNEIVVLEQSMGALELQNVPAGAKVLINGEEYNIGQSVFERLCEGEYFVEVISTAGRFSDKIVISSGDTAIVSVKIRPVLIVVGPVFSDSVEESLQSSDKNRLENYLDKITAYQVIRVGNEARSNSVPGYRELAERISTIFELPSNSQVPDSIHKHVRSLCRHYSSNVVSALFISERNFATYLEFALFNFEIPNYEKITVNFNESKEVDDLLNSINQPMNFFTTWLGITAIDTRIHEGTVVIDVQSGSPASENEISTGDTIAAVNESAIKSNRDLNEVLHSKIPGDTIDILINKGNEGITKQLKLGSSPVLLSLNNSNVLYSFALAGLAAIRESSDDERIINLSYANSGIALAHFGAWDNAIKFLRRSQLGDAPGINQGTVNYYIGLCFENLGMTSEAVKYYQQALQFEGATLDSNDGPSVLPIIRHRIKQLEVPQ